MIVGGSGGLVHSLAPKYLYTSRSEQLCMVHIPGDSGKEGRLLALVSLLPVTGRKKWRLSHQMHRYHSCIIASLEKVLVKEK